jgi:uncharacterized coiled-coil protein SlyX
MLTNLDILEDRIKTLEGILQYQHNNIEETNKLFEENKVLKREILRLERRIKHLINELEFE